MIRLCSWIDRLLERRWLGAIVLVALVLLLVVVLIHPVDDDVIESAALVCGALVLAVGAARVQLPLAFSVRPQAPAGGRGPPVRIARSGFDVPSLNASPTPLRR